MRTFVLIGGGEIKSKTTLAIDKYIVSLARERITDGHRPYALFFPTASGDSNPYFNSFRKTYTSECDVKSDVAILLKGLMTIEHVAEKIAKADIIYVGGGNTLRLIDTWKETGIDKLVLEAYKKGTIICGLSAGAICWFQKMYTDSVVEGEYHMHNGMGILNGVATPHYNHRPEFRERIMKEENIPESYAMEDDSAIIFQDEKLIGSISSGGKSYILSNFGETSTEIQKINE